MTDLLITPRIMMSICMGISRDVHRHDRVPGDGMSLLNIALLKNARSNQNHPKTRPFRERPCHSVARPNSRKHTMRIHTELITVALLTLAAPLSATNQPPPPNILILIADDLGWNDVGWHDSPVRTPVMDALVAESVELDQHYVMPVCTPTRVALMTGRYPSRFGLEPTSPSNLHAIPFDTPTLANLFQSAGYDTALIGKWHMGSKPEWGPNKHGFNYSYGSLAGAVGMYDHRYRLDSPYKQTWHRNGQFLPPNIPGHATDLVTEEAIGFIKKDRKSPFLLWVAFHSVHTPLVEDAKWLRKNEHIASTDRRLFAGAVTHLDACIGKIIKALEDSGQRKNTIVLFISDNGGKNNHTGGQYPPPDSTLHNYSSNEPLRGQKAQTFEGGIRVPAFIQWPGTLKPRKVTLPIHAVDWLPTFAAIANIKLPKTLKQDGQNIWPQINDGAEYKTPRTFYWVKGKRWYALRHGDWKIVRQRQKPWMLFNLAKDPNETTNFAEQQPKKLQALIARFKNNRAQDP